MEKFSELIESSQKKLALADHILTVTYPLAKDPKLLITLAENIFLSFSYAISSLMYYELKYKRISSFDDSFKTKFNIFREECAGRYGIENIHIKAIQELREVLLAHKKSPMEFPRKESFVICDESYESKILTQNILKEYLKKAKLFIKRLSTIVKKEL